MWKKTNALTCIPEVDEKIDIEDLYDLEGDELMSVINSEFVPVDYMKEKQDIFIKMPTPLKKKNSLDPLPTSVSSGSITSLSSTSKSDTISPKMNIRGQIPLPRSVLSDPSLDQIPACTKQSPNMQIRSQVLQREREQGKTFS